MTTDKIYIGIDNEVIEAKGEALEYILDYQAKAKIRKEELIAEENRKAEAKATLLERLGITEEEAKLLLS
jgi:hypothetical protein